MKAGLISGGDLLSVWRYRRPILADFSTADMASSLTPEQQRKIEENRQRALARRAERLAQGTRQPVQAPSAPYPPCQSQAQSPAGGSGKPKPSCPPRPAPRQVGNLTNSLHVALFLKQGSWERTGSQSSHNNVQGRVANACKAGRYDLTIVSRNVRIFSRYRYYDIQGTLDSWT